VIPAGLAIMLDNNVAVFPLRPKDKRPLTAHGCKDATTDSQQIIEWSREHPNCNWGAATGNDLIAIDADRKKGQNGVATFERMEADHGGLPRHLTTETPNDGQHHFFRARGIKNSASKIAPGIDVRGEGGYVVVPPSELETGFYVYRDKNAPIPEAPDWVVALLTESHHGSIPEGKRNDTLYRYACALRARNLSEPDAWSALQLRNLDCAPPLSKSELRGILESAWKHAPGYRRNDTGNAQRFLTFHGMDVRYVAGLREWIVWQDEEGRWKPEPEGLSCIARVKQTIVTALASEVVQLSNAKQQEEHAKFLIGSQNQNRLEAAVRNARSEPGVLIEYAKLDADRYLIGTRNGTLNLRDGSHRPAQREDWITKQLGCVFERDAQAPMWLAFLAQATNGDDEMQLYLQQTVGMSLLGNLFRRVIFIYGPTATGKSVFLEVVKAMFGEYAKAAATDLLMVGSLHSKHGPTEALARLAGARFVSIGETNSGDEFDASQVKDLSGRDMLTARNMYQASFEFRPDFTIWIRGNHKPRFSGDDAAMLDRLRLIPFTHQVPESERDPMLLEKIIGTELPGVLNWALAGALAVQAQGNVSTPATVREATQEYGREMDLLGAFLEERCDTSVPDATAFSKDLYEAFVNWGREQGLRAPWTMQTFGRRMGERFKKERPNKLWLYRGVSLRPKL